MPHPKRAKQSVKRRDDIMAEEKHIVWSDINLDLEDWRDSLTEIYGDASEDFLYEKMCESNEMNFYDERANLNIQLPREIIVIADLGLWNGRFSGYKTIKSGNIRDCLCPECDYSEWYVDKKRRFSVQSNSSRRNKSLSVPHLQKRRFGLSDRKFQRKTV